MENCEEEETHIQHFFPSLPSMPKVAQEPLGPEPQSSTRKLLQLLPTLS